MARSIFEGVKIVDFGWVIAGPSTTRYLAEHGARVIRVESITHPDITRLAPPFKDRIPGINRSGYYACYNDNKYGMALNLQLPKGREIAQKLIMWADVVAESFSPGTMARWGWAYEDIQKIRPDLIMYSTSQQGQTGPHAKVAAFGTSLVSLAGFTWLGGWPDRGPAGPYAGYTDTTARSLGAVAVSAALDYRRRTGKGIHIDLSQYEAGVNFLAPVLLDYTVNGRVQGPQGNRCPDAAPHGVFPCKGYDRWCAIAVFTDEEWHALRQAMGNPAWAARPEFARLALRKRNEEELELQMALWTANHTAEEIMRQLQAVGVPAGVVQTGEEVHKDPHLAHREFLQELEHAEMGRHCYEMPPFRLSKTQAELTKAAPCLGEDTEYVCTKILGMSDEEFVELLADGVFE